MRFLESLFLRNRKTRNISMLVIDIFLICVAAGIGLLVRFDFMPSNIPAEYLYNAKLYLPIHILVALFCFVSFRMYSTMWSVAGIREAGLIFAACAIAEVFQIAGMTMLQLRMPRSYFVICGFSLYAMEMLFRFSYRIGRSLEGRLDYKGKRRRIMIVGAGEAGAMLLREVRSSQYIHGRVVCFVDDSEYKIGKNLNGISIYGGRNAIPQLVKRFYIDIIYIAIPSALAEERREIIDIAMKTGAEVKVLPGLYQLATGEVSIEKLREVQIEDLLGREPIRVNLNEIMEYVSGKVILVTGGGGSIGSELCRQIASHNPKQLIVFDIYENNAYDLQQELKEKFPELDLEVLIGSVRNTHRIESIFEKYRPDIVYHAAAHKHVPLMEESPNEAIKNNVFGTYKTAKAADKYGTKRFVLISTDKAVNPTNIMGASKRICEMIIQMMNHSSRTDFVAVRFGNVLGSNGSVIPLFKKQIEHGGPVTVTHPDIIRYFMTIPEAVSLVLQAGAYARGGEIFVLDMGKPVKILDLAQNLIRLSGYVPNKDIKIEFTGLRPGEKLYEELLMDEEGMRNTPNRLIHIGSPIEFDTEEFRLQLENLYKVCNNDSDNIRDLVQQIVPTYKPSH